MKWCYPIKWINIYIHIFRFFPSCFLWNGKYSFFVHHIISRRERKKNSAHISNSLCCFLIFDEEGKIIVPLGHPSKPIAITIPNFLLIFKFQWNCVLGFRLLLLSSYIDRFAGENAKKKKKQIRRQLIALPKGRFKKNVHKIFLLHWLKKKNFCLQFRVKLIKSCSKVYLFNAILSLGLRFHFSTSLWNTCTRCGCDKNIKHSR